jgi:hypothetical protein
MAEIYGNLALQRRRSASIQHVKRQSVNRQERIPMKRIPVTATPAPEQSSLAKARYIRHALACRRLKLLAGIVLTVLLVAAVFALVVYRQAMILEMNFQNLSVERQITKINQENGQISEDLAQKTNLDLIRHVAVERLGLQDPARSQIATVTIPDTDRVVFASPAAGNPDEEAYLASVFSTIEGYFKTLSQRRQGD